MAAQYTDFPALSPSAFVEHRGFSWTGIFAGTFLFLAIETTFGILGVAIFASATNPHAANPVGFGISAGAGIWMVILSILALYFAGKLASKLSGAATRNIGMYAGLVTFGMSIFTSILLSALVLGNTAGGTTGIAYASPARLADILSTGGYWLFVALVLAMISSALGGMHGIRGADRTTLERPIETRRVA